MSTGIYPRNCRECGTSFVGLGTLCPVHLGQHAREHSAELQMNRAASNHIITARENQAKANRPARMELVEELDQ